MLIAVDIVRDNFNFLKIRRLFLQHRTSFVSVVCQVNVTRSKEESQFSQCGPKSATSRWGQPKIFSPYTYGQGMCTCQIYYAHALTVFLCPQEVSVSNSLFPSSLTVRIITDVSLGKSPSLLVINFPRMFSFVAVYKLMPFTHQMRSMPYKEVRHRHLCNFIAS